MFCKFQEFGFFRVPSRASVQLKLLSACVKNMSEKKNWRQSTPAKKNTFSLFALEPSETRKLLLELLQALQTFSSQNETLPLQSKLTLHHFAPAWMCEAVHSRINQSCFVALLGPTAISSRRSACLHCWHCFHLNQAQNSCLADKRKTQSAALFVWTDAFFEMGEDSVQHKEKQRDEGETRRQRRQNKGDKEELSWLSS